MKLIPSRKSPEERAGNMSVVDHLTELRHRIVICLWAVGGAAIVAWFLYEPFKDIIRKPYCAFVAQNPQLAGPSGCELVFTSPIDGMLVKMKTVMFIAIGLALPILLYQLWAFIVPGLTSREKKYSIPFVVSSFLLFILGGLFAYFTLPKAFGFMLGFAGNGIVPLLASIDISGSCSSSPSPSVCRSCCRCCWCSWSSWGRQARDAVEVPPLRDLPDLPVRGDHHAELRPLYDARPGHPHVSVL